MDAKQIEYFKGLLRSKVQEQVTQNSDNPEICMTLRQLAEEIPLTLSVETAVETAQEVISSERDDFGVTKETSCKDFQIATTFFRTTRMPVVARSFPGGYLEWLGDAFERADQQKGNPAFAHWIMVMDNQNVLVHLTVTQQDKKKI